MLVGIWLIRVMFFEPYQVRQGEVTYNEFREHLATGQITEITLGTDRILYKIDDETAHNVIPVQDEALIADLLDAGVKFQAEPPTSGLTDSLFIWFLPLLPLALIWYFMFRRIARGSSNMLSLGKSKAQEITGQTLNISFDNVGGVGEVEVELKEIIDFLKNPEKYKRLGAKLPKGALLIGPPGTGKTLLAKATAGEAGVPFFSMSGSGFVEMFVGVGAARVRDLFQQAKQKAPCIIFIDEIDAIGQSRSSAIAFQTNDERDQTLNQLLAEMDGFDASQGVVIMAATNRPEVLDKALLRPGRFDRQIMVPLPTEDGRLEILGIHTREIKLAPEVDLVRIAKITPGFSGADLANIANEASLMAVRRDAESVTMDDFDLAIERVVAGLQRKSPLSEEVRKKVAYHEGGHALVAELLPTSDQVHKVSIIPTSKGALGYTMQMPEEDEYLIGETELKERLCVMLGGRAAEILIFNEATTGASNDLERATELARRMVTEFGMTEALGPVRYATNEGLGNFLGVPRGMQEISPDTVERIDREIKRLVEEAQQRAMELLRDHERELHLIADILQEQEVISGERVHEIAHKRQTPNSIERTRPYPRAELSGQ